jgi:hypothetical protein
LSVNSKPDQLWIQRQFLNGHIFHFPCLRCPSIFWQAELLDIQAAVLAITEASLAPTAVTIANSYMTQSIDGFRALADLILMAAACRTPKIDVIAELCAVLKRFLLGEGRPQPAQHMTHTLHSYLFPQYTVCGFEQSQVALVYHLFQRGVFSFDEILAGFERLKSALALARKKPEDSTNEIHLHIYGLLFYFGPLLESREGSELGTLLEQLKSLPCFTELRFRRASKEFAGLRANDWAEWHAYFDAGARATTVVTALRNDDLDALVELMRDPTMSVDRTLPPRILEPSELLQGSPTLVQAAAYFGSVKCLKYLILNGADVRATAKNDLGIAQFAVVGGSLEIIRLIEEKISLADSLLPAIEYSDSLSIGTLDRLRPLFERYPITSGRISSQTQI